MRHRLTSLFSVLLVLSLAAFICGPVLARPSDDNATTEDIVYMNDLRELHGHIISEAPSEIVFEYVDRTLNLRSKITLRRADIAKIARDVAIPADQLNDKKADASETTTASDASIAKTDDATGTPTYGIKRASDITEHTKKIYFVPMEGQMGTDVNPDVYEEMVADIREKKPDYLIIKMKCQDTEDRLYTRWGEEEQGGTGSQYLDMYRDLVGIFHDELRDIPQVLWIEDSEGISSVIAMSWPNMYMMPHARLGGLESSAINFLHVKEDFNTLGKYREAYMAWLKGFAEFGGYDLHLLDAMVRPEKKLSASWKGRNVNWALDDSGEYVVDASDKITTSFRAKSAEDFCISKGTAETPDDLALLLGIREYVVLDSKAEEIFQKYKDGWRRTLEQCDGFWDDYGKYMGWASGEDTVRYLGRAKNCLEKILAALERYKAVEVRLAMEHGLTKFWLVTKIEQINEQLRAARSAGRNNGAGSSGGGSTKGGGLGR